MYDIFQNRHYPSDTKGVFILAALTHLGITEIRYHFINSPNLQTDS